MALSITDAQAVNVVDAVDAHIEDAFAAGVDAPSYPALLDAMTEYTSLSSSQKAGVKDVFRQVVAAIAKTLGITGPFAAGAFTTGQTVVISYMKADGVTTGTLTFTNGVLTAST